MRKQYAQVKLLLNYVPPIAIPANDTSHLLNVLNVVSTSGFDLSPKGLPRRSAQAIIKLRSSVSSYCLLYSFRCVASGLRPPISTCLQVGTRPFSRWMRHW